jgi:hypothetical protein
MNGKLASRKSARKGNEVCKSPDFDQENWIFDEKVLKYLTPKAKRDFDQSKPRLGMLGNDGVFLFRYLDEKRSAHKFLPPLKPTLHRPRHVQDKKPAQMKGPSILTITFSNNKLGSFRGD